MSFQGTGIHRQREQKKIANKSDDLLIKKRGSSSVLFFKNNVNCVYLSLQQQESQINQLIIQKKRQHFTFNNQQDNIKAGNQQTQVNIHIHNSVSDIFKISYPTYLHIQKILFRNLAHSYLITFCSLSSFVTISIIYSLKAHFSNLFYSLFLPQIYSLLKFYTSFIFNCFQSSILPFNRQKHIFIYRFFLVFCIIFICLLQEINQHHEKVKVVSVGRRIPQSIEIAKKFEKLERNISSTYAKSSKQCRERYINYSRFVGSQKCELNLFWSPEDDRVLAKLYNKYGSAWSSFTTSLKDKSQNSIKNRFYNRLKKFAKKLDDHRSTHSEQVRIKSSSYESMIRILDFSNQIKSLCENSKVDFNKETNMFTARDDILHLCFDYTDDSEIPCEQYCRLSRKMKQINVKIRCFGICKAKNRKNWKLTQQGFLSSLGFEKTDLFNVKKQQPVQANVGNSRNINEAQTVNAQTINHQVIAAENENAQEARQHYDHFHFLNPYMYLNPYNFFMVPPPYLLPMGQPVKLEEGGTNVRQVEVKREQVVKRQDS